MTDHTPDHTGLTEAELSMAERTALEFAVIDDRDRRAGYAVRGPGGTDGNTPTLLEAVSQLVTDRTAELRDRAEKAEAERDRLARWKAEAREVIEGVHHLGRALGIPLGLSVVGPEAVAAAEALVAERDRLRDALAALAGSSSLAERDAEVQPCGIDAGSRPYWMGVDQYDPCPCVRPKGHDGPHGCADHDKPADAVAPSGADADGGQG